MMPSLPQLKTELETMRADLFQPFQDAKARGDSTEMARLTSIAGEIDDALDSLAIIGLNAMSMRLAALRAQLDTLTKKVLAWPFGIDEAPDDFERSYVDHVPANDFADQGPTLPAPSPSSNIAAVVPAVSSNWAKEYSERWATIQVLPDWSRKADAIARKIVACQTRYAAATAGTNVPWWFVAVLHAMECSLRFDRHLHNGDPLLQQTSRVPKGRPPVGSPPFTWEESARDAVNFEKLNTVTDWSVPSALFHWHRYNGINNEYKRQGIPTPYLWSGSQHYRKGKYVADHVFDSEAVSQQVGAAVLLNALVELGAVGVAGKKKQLEGNPAAAVGEVGALAIDISGPDLKHGAAELNFPGIMRKGATATKADVRRIQEWLNIHGCVTPIDEGFGNSTEDQLKSFQIKNGRPATGELDADTWALLTAPMRRALAAADHGANPTLERAIIDVAVQHLNCRPVEIGGNNMGPWVRLYMKGKQGTSERWCAGFVCFVAAQAARDLGQPMPFKRQVGVDSLVADAKGSKKFLAEKSVQDPIGRKSTIPPGSLFVVRESPQNWTHVGIVLQHKSQTFDTLEGNTGGDGGVDGANAQQGNRSYANKDFIRLS